MKRYVIRRVAAFVVTLLFVSILVFVVVRVLPGDAAELILGTERDPETTERLRESLGLNRPLAVQYVEWLGGALRGDLGRSIQYDVPVGRLIVSRLPVTLPLTLLAATFMIAVAVPLGVILFGMAACALLWGVAARRAPSGDRETASNNRGEL